MSNPNGPKTVPIRHENVPKKAAEIENVACKRACSETSEPSGNGCHQQLELKPIDMKQLKCDPNSGDEKERKKQKLDDKLCTKSGFANSSQSTVPVDNCDEDLVSIDNGVLGDTNENGQSTTAPKTSEDPKQPSPPAGGSFMAGSLVLSNSILDEVLNDKKLSILQSPAVIEFLQQAQRKRRSADTDST